MGITSRQKSDVEPANAPVRVVVKLAESAMRGESGESAPEARLRAVSALRHIAPDAEFTPYFDEDLEAATRAPFDRYIAVEVPDRGTAMMLARALQEQDLVEEAYVEGGPVPPPVSALDDPRSANQGYLDAAPGGIDARWAWSLTDGAGIGFVDLERGWTLDHEDLQDAGITLISGLNQDFHGHGTAVLGEVVAVDNMRGGVGIAPRASCRVVSQWRTATNYNTAAAILSAGQVMNKGDVLLLEAQTTYGTVQNLPVEVETAVFDAIRHVTDQGIVVVEAAGNGGHDLDAFTNTANRQVLNRNSADFRDSGAIMVGAATSTVPHARMSYSCFGTRVDCFGWGQNIDTAGDGWQGNAVDSYTAGFSGTSGASPIVAGAAVLLQSWHRTRPAVYSPDVLRGLLSSTLNTASANPATDRIGVMPNLRAIIEAEIPNIQWHPANDEPVIAVNLQHGLDFGTICGGPGHLTLQVFNVGGTDLVIQGIYRLTGSTAFTVHPLPATPLVIRPGEEVDFTIAFTPTTPGTLEQAIIRIRSNDPGTPDLDLLAAGTGGTTTAAVAIADDGEFGLVCLGSLVDRDLVINNPGQCRLEISAITSTSAAFVVPGVISFPLAVDPGGSITLPLRFQPVALGAEGATIRVFTNDPASPAEVLVTGTAPAPRLVLSPVDAGNFGNTCVGTVRDLPLTVSNSGRCPLTITGLTSSSPEFLVPDVIELPLVVAPGSFVALHLRFQPISFGTKTAVLMVTSDDPAGPAMLTVTGNAPSGHLVVTGTTHFGAVELGERALQAISICNVGLCPLHVTRVAFKPLGPCERFRHRCGGLGCGGPCSCKDPCHPDGECDQRCLNFEIVTNPFPAMVHPGSCLDILIQYVPTCDSTACCELVIESDDPSNPSQTLLVAGHLRRTLGSALKCWAAQQLQEVLVAGKG